MDIAKVRQEICTVGKLLFEDGLVAANEGNISVRIGENEILLTPAGVCKGQLEPHMLVRCTLDGTVCTDDTSGNKPSSEIALHTLVYRSRSDVMAIVHAHPPVATAFTALTLNHNKDMQAESSPSFLECAALGNVPVCPYAPPSSSALAESVAYFVQDYQAALLTKHGAVTWNSSLQEAFENMQHVEQMACDNMGDKRAGNMPEPVSLRKDKAAVSIVDQSVLPKAFTTVDLANAQDMKDALCKLKVRGAPTIGVAAAWFYYVLARQTIEAAARTNTASGLGIRAQLSQHASFLNSARPTAVNLSWALARMEAIAEDNATAAPEELLLLLESEARVIHYETLHASNEIAWLGASLLEDGWSVITHCNAGPLACMGYGTGQGPFYYAHDHGMKLHAYVDETRPLLQGARITSFELTQAGIDTTLVCDNMAAQLMREGRIQACLVGCDRVAANGDFANKVGTSGLAVLAKHYRIPFYVLGPTSTIDLACATGADIPIEERDEAEIKEMFFAQPIAPEAVRCYNPAFDICDHSLVSAIVTERGICRPPYTESIAALFA